jgi:hypothetical protein
MSRNEQHEDVAGAQFLLDLPLPVGPARHQPVDPKIDRALLDRRPQIAGHERQPLDLALGRMLRLVGVGVADDDQRLVGLGRHAKRGSRKSDLGREFTQVKEPPRAPF